VTPEPVTALPPPSVLLTTAPRASQGEARPAADPIEAGVAAPSVAAHNAFWVWVGAHGGAGTTTLAEAVPGGVDLGRAGPWEHGLALPAVVVCRGSARGLSAARTFAARSPADAALLGLVVVADMPGRRRPKALAEGLYLTSGAYTAVWEMPWVPAWHLGEDPSPANNPRAVPELLRVLWAAVGLCLPGAMTSSPITPQRRSRH